MQAATEQCCPEAKLVPSEVFGVQLSAGHVAPVAIERGVSMGVLTLVGYLTKRVVEAKHFNKAAFHLKAGIAFICFIWHFERRQLHQ
jgi:hypothetical protein